VRLTDYTLSTTEVKRRRRGAGGGVGGGGGLLFATWGPKVSEEEKEKIKEDFGGF